MMVLHQNRLVVDLIGQVIEQLIVLLLMSYQLLVVIIRLVLEMDELFNMKKIS
jgi:hypothetical protein